MNKCLCKNPSYSTDNERNELICIQCGTVMSENVNDEMDLITGPSKYQQFGTNAIGSKKIQQYSKNMQTSSTNRTHAKLQTYVTSICERLNLPTIIISESIKLGTQCVNDKLARGRSIEGIAAACVLITCRKNNRIMLETDVFKVITQKKKVFRRIYRDICLQYDFKLIHLKHDMNGLISKICNTLDININIEKKALQMIDDLYPKLDGHNPSAVVAGIMIWLCNDIPQKRICKVANITDVSARAFINRFLND